MFFIDVRLILGLRLICHLLPNLQIKKNLGKSYRPSKIEVASSFFGYFCSKFHIFKTTNILLIITNFQFQNQIEADSNIENQKKQAEETKTPIQPKVFIIGPLESSIACVRIHEIIFNFVNIFEAIDCCFKLFWSLNLKYPEESKHCWLFIQKIIYKIKSVNDFTSAGVSSLIKEIENAS